MGNMRRAQGTTLVPNGTVLRVAETLRASPKTVRKVIYGKPVRGRVAAAIRRELERRRALPAKNGALNAD